MTMTRGMVRAAGLTLLLAGGCAWNDYFSLSYWQRDASGQTSGLSVSNAGGSPQITLAGNPDFIVQRFQQALSRMGLQVQVASDAQGIHLTSTTRTGKQLSVTLRRELSADGREATQVQMDWIGGADKEVEAQLMTMLVPTGSR